VNYGAEADSNQDWCTGRTKFVADANAVRETERGYASLVATGQRYLNGSSELPTRRHKLPQFSTLRNVNDKPLCRQISSFFRVWVHLSMAIFGTPPGHGTLAIVIGEIRPEFVVESLERFSEGRENLL
jgi:hypothetical protein